MPAEEIADWIRDWELPRSWQWAGTLAWPAESLYLIAGIIFHRSRIRTIASTGEPGTQDAHLRRWHEVPCPLQSWLSESARHRLNPRLARLHQRLHEIEATANAVALRQSRSSAVETLREGLAEYEREFDALVNEVGIRAVIGS